MFPATFPCTNSSHFLTRPSVTQHHSGDNHKSTILEPFMSAVVEEDGLRGLCCPERRGIWAELSQKGKKRGRKRKAAASKHIDPLRSARLPPTAPLPPAQSPQPPARPHSAAPALSARPAPSLPAPLTGMAKGKAQLGARAASLSSQQTFLFLQEMRQRGGAACLYRPEEPLPDGEPQSRPLPIPALRLRGTVSPSCEPVARGPPHCLVE